MFDGVLLYLSWHKALKVFAMDDPVHVKYVLEKHIAPKKMASRCTVMLFVHN